MAWSKGTSATNGTFNPTTGATETVSVTRSIGDIVVVALSIAVDTSNLPTAGNIASSLSNAYTRIAGTAVLDTVNHQRLEWWFGKISTGGADTLTPGFQPTPGTTTALAVTINADPFSGSDSSSTTDGTGAAQNQSAPGTGTDAVTSGAFTTSTNGSLLVAACVDTQTGLDPGSLGTGFTLGSLSSAATTIVTRTEFMTIVTAGSVAGTFTAASGGNRFLTSAFAITPAGSVSVIARVPLPSPRFVYY